jgi:hypothetical protein
MFAPYVSRPAHDHLIETGGDMKTWKKVSPKVLKNAVGEKPGPFYFL